MQDIGYEDQLESCFFKMNEGLNRRFSFRYKIEEYTPSELNDIFMKKLSLGNWTCDYDLTDFFKTNAKSFPNFGGDMETLFLNAKINKGKRMIFSSDKSRVLNKEDIDEGFKNFLSHRKKSTCDNNYYNYDSLWN